MTNKGGANPKYLDLETETKKQVNFRLPIDIIEKLQTIGKFTNKTNTEIVTELLSDYLSNKILTNNYLDLETEIYLKIPEQDEIKHALYVTAQEIENNKRELKQRELITIANINEFYYDKLMESIGNQTRFKIGESIKLERKVTEKIKSEIWEKIKNYIVLLIPNNLDRFDSVNLTYKTVFKDGQEGHAGIDFLIIPGLVEYKDYLNDLGECLYIFYFKHCDGNTEIYLIDYVDAVEIIGDKNENLKNLLKTIYIKLIRAETLEDVTELANLYNTGNFKQITDETHFKPNLIKVKDKYISNIGLYSYETLNNKLEALEKENQDLKDKINELEAQAVSVDEFKKEAQALINDIIKRNDIDL